MTRCAGHPDLPVDDTVRVEVFEGKQYFRCVEFRLPKRELLALNVQHEITTAHVLHNEVDTRLCLETRVQAKQEWVALLGRSKKDALLRTSARI